MQPDKQAEIDAVCARLAAEAEADEGFAKFLGVERRDLDPAITPLVYVLYKKQIVKTTFSCSGHTGRSHINAGGAITAGTYVFCEGALMFEDVETDRSNQFFALAEEIPKTYPFAFVRRVQKGDWNKHCILLTMADIATRRETVLEVPEALALERLQLFYLIWKQLAAAVAAM